MILLCGFHQLRFWQKLVYEQHACDGYCAWFVDAGIIAEMDQAIEGRHYYRIISVLKESFNALIQRRVEDITQPSIQASGIHFSQ